MWEFWFWDCYFVLKGLVVKLIFIVEGFVEGSVEGSVLLYKKISFSLGCLKNLKE